MRLFLTNRPLAACALAFTLGVALARLWESAWMIGAGAFVLALAFYLLKKPSALVLACAAALFLGTVRFAAAECLMPQGIAESGMLEGRLAEDAYTSGGESINMVLEDAALNGEPLKGRVLLRLYAESLPGKLPEYGTTVRVRADVRALSPQRNPGGYDERLSLRARNVAHAASGQAESAAFKNERAFSLYGGLLGLRRSLKNAVSAALPNGRAALLSAMLFGDKQQLSETEYADFRLSGAAHVLAVSGLHVMALAMALGALLKKLRAGPMKTFFVSAAFLLAYSVLAAFSVSVVRASIMALIVLLGHALGRRRDMLTSMAFAAAAILFVNPYQLFTPGFQLSFCAVFGIFALQPPLGRLLMRLVPERHGSKRWATYLTAALAVSLAAQIATIPPMLCWFQSITPVGTLTNLLVVPLAGLIVTIGLPFAILSALLPAAGALLAPFFGVLLDALAFVAKLFALKDGVVFLPPMPSTAVLLFLALCVPAFVYHKRRPKRSALSFIGVFAAFAIGVAVRLLPPPGAQLVMLDVGQGDSILIRSGSAAMLIDAGSARRLDYGEAVVLPALRTLGVLRLDSILMTHPDEDHMGGISSVLASMDVGVLLGDARDPKSTHVLEALEASGTPCAMPTAGQQFRLGSANLRILRAAPAKTTNESSIVALFTYGGAAALFTGDLDANSERPLLRLGEIDVLKVAHHGSKYSTTPALVNALRPRLALVSVGRNNYGHPDPAVLERLEAQGASVMRTDSCGAVFVSIGREKIDVHGMLGRDKMDE